MTDWKEYELHILDELRPFYPNAQFEYDKKVTGKFSKITRQVDIVITEFHKVLKAEIAVECKYYNKKIDTKMVESFISMLKDLNMAYGIIVTNVGYTKGAETRIYNDESIIDLEIVNLAELKPVQCDIAAHFFPFLEYFFTTMPPFGFVLDQKHGYSYPYLCFYFLRGLTVEEAFIRKEWLDVSYFPKKRISHSLQQLMQIDHEHMLNVYSQPTIENYSFSWKGVYTDTGVRVILLDQDLIIYKLFIESTDFIIAFNLYTRPIWEPKNIRKLHYLIDTFEAGKIQVYHLEYLKEKYGTLNPEGHYNIMYSSR